MRAIVHSLIVLWSVPVRVLETGKTTGKSTEC
nr:MAG TPA: hypothetical protein [Caudoviricetes sp.]